MKFSLGPKGMFSGGVFGSLIGYDKTEDCIYLVIRQQFIFQNQCRYVNSHVELPYLFSYKTGFSPLYSGYK